MSGVNISEDAREDLREIWEFVSAKDVEAVMRLLKQITDKFDTLLSFPAAGRERDDLIVGLRGALRSEDTSSSTNLKMTASKFCACCTGRVMYRKRSMR